MIRIGILGAARIAPAALIEPAAEIPEVAVVAVAARDPGRARAFAAEHGIPHAAENYAALIARHDVDLVYVALTPVGHAEWSIRALEAGKHVLCEKPLAMNAREAETMVAAAERTGRHMIEAFHYRFHPLFGRVLEIVRGGQLGAVRAIDAVFDARVADRPDQIRFDPVLGGGAGMDLGCYPIHWARTLAGEEPEVVWAEAAEGPPGIDMAMSADLNFPNDIAARIGCAMAHDRPERHFSHLIVQGDRGRLTVQNPLSPHTGHRLTVESDGNRRSESVDGGTTYAHQLAHVIDVLASRTAPVTGSADAIANMAVIDAIYTAAGMAPRGLSGPGYPSQ